MSQNETTTILFCHRWNVPSVELPQSPVCINVLVVYARYILKKQAGVRIPDSVSKSLNISLIIEKSNLANVIHKESSRDPKILLFLPLNCNCP